ncbi:DUF721 domain-containing protein [Hirschia maritima]|uniref:DUF721 domain-containing protein n=1 Tax=Hirschia maritima TaxID=1121961 RepID=UPI00037395C7|nr:DciA family protein [Hirschia maritima]
MNKSPPSSKQPTAPSEAEGDAIKKLKQMRGKRLQTENGLSPLAGREDTRGAKQDLARRRGKPIYHSARPLSRAMYKTVYPALKGKDSGAALSSLQRRWPEVLGKDLASLCEPIQILKPTTGYVLVLEANSASAALKLKHQTDIILERVNAGSGARFKGIRLQQTKTKHQSVKATTKLRHQITPEEAAEIEATLDGVESSSLKRALQRLGEAVKSKTETEKTAAIKQIEASSKTRRVRSFKSRR